MIAPVDSNSRQVILLHEDTVRVGDITLYRKQIDMRKTAVMRDFKAIIDLGKMTVRFMVPAEFPAKTAYFLAFAYYLRNKFGGSTITCYLCVRNTQKKWSQFHHL